MNFRQETNSIHSTFLTLDQRIQALYESGLTCAAQVHRRVSRTVRVAKRTVERKINRLKQGLSLEKEERKTRNDKFLSEEMKDGIEEYLAENPCATAQQIIVDLNLNISVWTMRRALKEIGYKYTATLKIPLMTSQHIDDRMWFAQENRRTNWDNAVFVDECTFMTYPFPKKAYQKPGQRVVYECPKKPAKLHVWGGITMRGKVTLHIFTENLTGLLYKKILWKKLLPSMRRLYGESRWVLVQDNDPKHTSKTVKNYMQKANIILCEGWPAASPDLNPIENIWGIMKHEVSKKRPETLEELEDAIKIIWRRIPHEYIVNCIQSMPKRLRLVVTTRGSKIPY